MAHPNFLLNSRTLVVGGTSGIGFAVASGALASGSKVHITSATAQKLSTKIKELQSFYSNVHVSGSAIDLSNAEALEAALQSTLDAAVKETGGPLDHIVYTAGDTLIRVSLAETTAMTALAPFTVRYLGPVLIAKLVAANPGRYLNPKHTSSITLTSGTLAHRPVTSVSSSIGVAGAVETFSRALAVEFAPIRVNVVIPGAVRTELLDRLTGGNLDVYKSRTLTKEIGTAAEAAEAYLFCMRSALAAGQGFIADNGGMLA
ncbi:hypothetical protein DFH06DRAFT_1261777 [Mycena polygramma]|nr:hypothetical protein DFH06DRAFT_1261777 [Mycena polygramma]